MPRLNLPRPISLHFPSKPSLIAILLAIVLSLSACARFSTSPYGSGPFQSSPFQSSGYAPRTPNSYGRSNSHGTSSSSGTSSSHDTVDSWRRLREMPKGGGRRVLGKPYWMLGRRYVPRRDPEYDRRGDATWISPKLHGNRTANGEFEDLNALVAAHPTLPLPSYAEVTNLSNGCRIFLRLNDRGPFVPGRIVDMSPRAAKLLRFYRKGVTRVRLRFWGPAPISGDDSFERQYLRRYPDLGCRHARRARKPGAHANSRGYRGASHRLSQAQPAPAQAVPVQYGRQQAAPYRDTYQGPTGVAYSGNE